MALKIQPKTVVDVVPEVAVPAATVLVQDPVSEVEALASEYIELWRKCEYFEVKEIMKRMDAIRKQLQTVANETMPGNDPAIFACKDGEIEFSARGKSTEVPDPLALVQVLLEKFGTTVAASVVEIALTPLRQVMSELELKAYLTESPGTRTLKRVRPVGQGG